MFIRHSMKFTVTSNDLLLQLQAVAKVINQKSVAAVPVLENILFELQGNILTLTAADQSNRLTCSLEVNNQAEDGAFAVRSNIVLDAIKELSDQPIEIEVDSEGGKATITYSNGHYSFLSTSADVYPEGLELNAAHTFVMPAQSLLKGLERTLYAASDDDTRPIMTGVYLDFFPDKLVTVASNIKCGETASFCLPARIAQLLTRGILAKEAGEVTLSFDERNASFTTSSGSLTARLLEGKFPNYNSVIPTSSVHNIIVDKDQLFFASKRVSLFSNRASSLVILDFADDSIRITGQDLDLSIAAEETISCSGQQAGTRLRIGFDFSYLQRLLQNVSSEQIQFSLNDQTRAGVITPLTSDEGIDITALIIPMKLLGE